MSFIEATRQNYLKLPVLKFDAGNRSSLDLPRVGLLSKLYLRIQGKLTRTGTGAVTLKANQHGRPYGLIDRIRLQANGGTEIWNITGHGQAIRNMMTSRTSYHDLPSTALNEAVVNNPVYKFPQNLAIGDNDVEFTMPLPLALNDRDPIGMLLLQNGETLVTLHLDWANPSTLYTLAGDGGVTFTGTATLHMEYFSVPDREEDYPDLSLIVQVIEDTVNINGTGDHYYTIPRGNIYRKMIHRIYLNDQPAGFDDVTNFILQYNQAEQPYRIDGHQALFMVRDRYGRDLPQGVYGQWDWAYQGTPNLGGNRDLINSKFITDFQEIINISTTATLGANNNKMLTIREMLVPLEA